MVLYFHDLAMTLRSNGGNPDADFYNEPRAPTQGETYSYIMPAAYAFGVRNDANKRLAPLVHLFLMSL